MAQEVGGEPRRYPLQRDKAQISTWVVIIGAIVALLLGIAFFAGNDTDTDVRTNTVPQTELQGTAPQTDATPNPENPVRPQRQP